MEQMFTYRKTGRYFAQVAADLAEAGAEELRALGAQEVKSARRGLYFDADNATLYRVCYCARLLSRVLAELLRFDCHSDKYLYKTASKIDWSALLSPAESFAIFANVSDSQIRHSRYAAQRLKDAIVDQFRRRHGQRPSVDTEDPDLWINLHIRKNKATINADVSGGALHKRGYRRQSVEAPMQETLAAAIVEFSQWRSERRLYDPLCGSGTLLLEAWMRGCAIPAGYLRPRFGFERLPGYDPAAWRRVKNEADAGIAPLPAGRVGGSDSDAQAVKAARTNAAALPHAERVPITRTAFQDLPPLENTVLLCNPPYGVRLGRGEDLAAWYGEFGDFLKQRCRGSTAYVYIGEREHIKHVGLKAARRLPLRNAGLDGRLVTYEIY